MVVFLSRFLLPKRGCTPHGSGKNSVFGRCLRMRCVTFDEICKSDRPLLPTVALSWHHWTPLKRCGCRSGNMKKTEHVPSTGRPSSRGRRPAIAPRTALKTPPSYCRRVPYSCTCHLPVPLHHPLSTQPLLNHCQPTASPPSSQRNTHVYVW